MGQKSKCRIPLPTPPPAPTSTLEPAQATLQACEKVIITFSRTIRFRASRPITTCRRMPSSPTTASSTRHGLPGDETVIPLCERAPTPVADSTPTAPPPLPGSQPVAAAGWRFVHAGERQHHPAMGFDWYAARERGLCRHHRRCDRRRRPPPGGLRLRYRSTSCRFLSARAICARTSSAGGSAPCARLVTDAQGQPVWTSAGANSIQRVVFSWQGVAPEAPAAITGTLIVEREGRRHRRQETHCACGA